MLAGKYRFHSRGGVRYTLSKGKSFHAKAVTMVVSQNSRGGQRFAVVVSKKVLKSAVGRNRIRRRIYEAIRLNKPDNKVANDYVFIINSKEIATCPFDEIAGTINDLLGKTVV